MQIMAENGRLNTSTEYLQPPMNNRMEFMLDSWFSQMLMNYQNESVIQTILGDGQIWAGMGFAKQFADNVDIDYAIRADVTKSGGGRGYLVPVEVREEKRAREQELAKQQMQLEMEKTRSEAMRNAAGAANLNNSGGFNGGAQ